MCQNMFESIRKLNVYVLTISLPKSFNSVYITELIRVTV